MSDLTAREEFVVAFIDRWLQQNVAAASNSYSTGYAAGVGAALRGVRRTIVNEASYDAGRMDEQAVRWQQVIDESAA